jgi:hypothetical protein
MVFDWKSRDRLLLILIVLIVGASESVQAGTPFRRRAPVLVPSGTTVRQPSSPYAGTFYPTPYMTVRGNAPAGGGYSPLGMYGESTMALYGPLSALRSTAAPLITYSRGYDGRTVIQARTSFSTPNLPGATPVIYPTQATYYYGFRESGDPPWWSSGTNWIDQN